MCLLFTPLRGSRGTLFVVVYHVSSSEDDAEAESPSLKSSSMSMASFLLVGFVLMPHRLMRAMSAVLSSLARRFSPYPLRSAGILEMSEAVGVVLVLLSVPCSPAITFLGTVRPLS